jgi:hypothetical protein
MCSHLQRGRIPPRLFVVVVFHHLAECSTICRIPPSCVRSSKLFVVVFCLADSSIDSSTDLVLSGCSALRCCRLLVVFRHAGFSTIRRILLVPPCGAIDYSSHNMPHVLPNGGTHLIKVLLAGRNDVGRCTYIVAGVALSLLLALRYRSTSQSRTAGCRWVRIWFVDPPPCLRRSLVTLRDAFLSLRPTTTQS